MKKSNKIIVAVVIVAVLVAAIAFRLINNKKEIKAKVYQPDVSTAVAVQVDTVKSGEFDSNISYTGSFSPNREVIIGSETSGKVIAADIKEGASLKSGQLIAQLDAGLISAQLQSAQASYDRAVNTLNRYQQALSGVTQLQLDNAKTDVLTSKAQIDQLKKQIRQFTIVAPFNGIVTSKDFDLGTIVSPGMKMVTLTDISSLKLEINVPEKNISQFKLGQTADINTDIRPGSYLKGKVEVIGSKADASHNFAIKMLVPNSDLSLKSGMYGTVVIHNNVISQALTIPRSALIGSSLKPQVYVLENGMAKLRNIQTGDGNETRIKVVSGLKSGELVAAGGLVNLTNGTKVSIVK
ncbi:efflux RND transporter periplasmic adaptor subunit [Mucilaginibacter sp. HMF5004]|uniref:efflux RND transporter periplasmic adaptor subunit n=1 Tax=Mucilaginibacter rivuli TaxID=2857527 RepID=UPI001C5E887F|nr:efflux RND transporter periplasmic adaptor subunit [Mucilaginibacter rivuli]MBW4888927.1 efflux RND transporter periplasmic adaptor subunit [Mucilaginibacter rivuli]